MTPVEHDALRAVVREILLEALGSPGGFEATASGGEIAVAIRDDNELNGFAARLLELFEEPERREAIRSGRLRFRLARSGGAPAATPNTVADPVVVERGALTEKVVARAAKEGRRLVLGRGAVATPLALDKARTLGIEVERTA